MTPAQIHQLFPKSSEAALDDDQLLALYGADDPSVPRVRANFVSSVDGAATVGGLSGPLGGPADKRIFDLLRQLSDVILVGAGTVRAEGYGAMLLGEDASRWRTGHGLAAQPHFAIVSARLDLDATNDVFTDAPVRPIVLTTDSADSRKRQELAAVADVISCGATEASGKRIIEALTSRGLKQIHCEGGPSLLETLIADGVLDELCLTTSPLLEGGFGSRIVTGGTDGSAGMSMSLGHVLVSGSMLFSRYSRG